MAAQIIHDDDVAFVQRGDERLLDVSQEAFLVDGTVQNNGRVDAVMAQRRDKSQRCPVSMRHFCAQTLSLAASAMGARHIGLGPGFVEKDEA